MSKLPVRLVALSCLVAMSCVPPAPKIAFKHSEKRGTLTTNGLRFVLMPDPTTSLAEVDIRYDVGGREDYPNKAGLAHVIEHLMFQQRPIDGGPPLFQMIEGMAVTFNAYTSEDSTHYQNTVRIDNIEDSLKIEAARMAYGCKTISEDQFQREREVVRNEIRQRALTAEAQIPQLVTSSIYPKGHAYEHTVGGDDKELTNITLADACKFMHDYYVPERATVIIAGGFDPDKVVQLIEKSFGGIEKRAGAPRVQVKPFEVDHTTKTFTLDVERPSVHVAFALPPGNTPDGEMAEYGIENAFVRVARKGQEYGFATRVVPQILGGKLAPVFVISVELKSQDKLDEALDFVKKEVAQAHRGFDEGTADDIEEQQNRTKADYIESLEPLAARTNVVGDLVQFNTDVDFNSKDLYVFHALDKISKYDGAKVGAIVKKYIDMDKARIIIIKSSKEGIKGDARSTLTFQTKSDDQMVSSDVDTSEAHRPLKAQGELKILDAAKKFTLANGMNVILLPLHAMPIVSAEIVFNNAGTASTPDSPQLASAGARFLQLPIDAEAFAKTGVNVGCDAGPDTTTCETGGINIYLDIMMKGLERLITAGDYHQEQIEGWQKSQKTHLESKLEQQQIEFRRQFLTALYGAEHPYTTTGVTTADAVAKVHRDSLESYRKSHFVAGNATLIVVGDFDPLDAEKLARNTFGGWAKGSNDKAAIAKGTPSPGPVVIGVVGKELPQLSLQIGFPTGNGVDGQEAARTVLADMMNIRVGDVRFKLGSTYGLYAGHRAHRGPGAYVIAGGGVDAERAGESIKAIQDGLEMLRKGEHFDDDFVRARRKVLSGLLGVSTVTSELADRLAYVSTYGLQPSYYNTLLQQVAAVSTAQIHALIAQELDPSREVLVLLGDRPHLEKAFADAGLKDVKIIEPDYK